MIIYGKQLFLHLLNNRKSEIKEVFLSKECDKKLFSKIANLGVPIKKIDNKKAQSLAKGGNHQGFLAEVDDFKFAPFSAIKNLNFIAILYALNDIGNIGAITRTAYALGVDGIVVIAKNLMIEGVVRASSGAAYEIPICLSEDGMGVINELKQLGFGVYGTKKGGLSVKDIKFKDKIALLMGNEANGMPKKIYEKCDSCIGIKMKNEWDSLNVSAAFAIICDRIANG